MASCSLRANRFSHLANTPGNWRGAKTCWHDQCRSAIIPQQYEKCGLAATKAVHLIGSNTATRQQVRHLIQIKAESPLPAQPSTMKLADLIAAYDQRCRANQLSDGTALLRAVDGPTYADGCARLPV